MWEQSVLSLTCFIKSSDKLYRSILTNKYLSPYVVDYINGNGIPKRAIFLIWLTIGFSVLFVIDKIILQIMLLSIASIVSIYIWTRSSSKSDRELE
ncbi:DUF454 family protein [Clostridium sp. D2Q-14]|uniref:DUF454 family protein n=1 Tax=Anaeromonas gelatinilytica TaxID=2683194 RepID=UPI00193C745D|nr:DUF454 family protein [Anaeromonas gelatinilytica]